MTRTVTYDEAQWKLVPIDPTAEMMTAYASSEKMFNNSHTCICAAIKAAPPYPDQSVSVTDMVWIPVSERLPDHDLFVDVTIRSYKNKEYSERRVNILFCDSKFNIAQKYGEYVSHWMPLPSAPKEPE